MVKTSDLALAVRERWLSEGVFDKDVTNSDVSELERRVGALPTAYKEFLLIAGTQADNDEEGFLFWPPQEVRPVREVVSEQGYDFAGDEEAIVIADYLQESWWYGLWTAESKRGEGFIVLGYQREKPMSSIGGLEQLLAAYLSGSSELYPPERT